MAFKPNYRLDRAERVRRKATKKQEKLDAKAVRHLAKQDASSSNATDHDAASAELSEVPDGIERANEK